MLVRNEQWAGNPGGPERIVITVTDAAGAVRGMRDQALNVVAPPADPVPAARRRELSGRGVVVEVRGADTVENLNINLARPLFQ